MATTTLSQQEWQLITDKLEKADKQIFKFDVDGIIVWVRAIIFNRKVEILPMVNGEIEFAWFSTLEKEVPDFVPKIFATRTKKFKSGDVIIPSMTFESVAQMKRTWEKNNDSITLIN